MHTLLARTLTPSSWCAFTLIVDRLLENYGKQSRGFLNPTVVLHKEFSKRQTQPVLQLYPHQA